MKKFSVKKIWLAICILCIILMSISFLVYSASMKRVVSEFEERANFKEATYVQSMLDDTWTMFHENAIEFFYSSNARELQGSSTDSELWMSKGYPLQIEIKEFIAYNPIFEDIMMYYPDSNMVVGKYGVYPSRTYWLASYESKPPITYDSWSAILYSDERGEYTFLNEGEYSALFFTFGNSNHNTRFLIAKINAEEVSKRLNWVNQGSSRSFAAIASTDGTVYCAEGNTNAFVSSESNQLKELDENSYIITGLDCYIGGAEYLIATEKSQVFQTSSNILVVALIITACMCLLSCSIAYLLIKRQTKPLDQIVSILDKEGSNYHNEYDFISNRIQTVLNKYEEIAEQSNRQQIKIEQAFLADLFFNRDGSQRSVETISALYNISLENNYFSVITQQYIDLISEDEIVKLMIAWNHPAEIYWIRRNEVDVFLVNFDDVDGHSLKVLLDKLQEISNEQPPACSKIVSSPLQIWECLEECAKIMGRKDLLPSRRQNNSATGAQLGATVMAAFAQNIRDNDYISIYESAASIYDQYVFDKDPFVFACKKDAVVCTFMMHVPETPQDALKKLSAADSQETWVSAISYILAHSNNSAVNKQFASAVSIAQKTRNIIDSQYQNSALDLQKLSTVVGYSSSYISRIFKETYGVGVSQYLTQLRIEHAKEMILSGTENIKSIALAVGFAGDTQFIRAFRRYENMTPGSYRSVNIGTSTTE